MAKKAFIGVGHGGYDSGAVANGLLEKKVNLTMALACDEYLKAHGVITKLSRYRDENDDLTEEIRECNAFSPDVAVDIHNNAGGGDGAEAFCSVNGGLGRTLATNIMNELVAIGQNSRGVKTRELSPGVDYYGFIRETKAPASIVESAFLDNPTDVQAIDTTAEQKAFGVAIAKGILKTLGIEDGKTVNEPTVVPTDNPNRSTGALFTCTGLWTQKNGGTWYPSSELLYGKGDYTIGKVHKGAEHPYEALVNGEIVGFANDKCIDDEPSLPGTASKPTTQTKPTTTTKKKKLYLPKTANHWNVYPLNKAPVVGNQCGALNPSLFGGLTYDILGYPQSNVVTIQTRDFGKVNIYVGSETGAIIK